MNLPDFDLSGIGIYNCNQRKIFTGKFKKSLKGKCNIPSTIQSAAPSFNKT
jgi:hypothetical protein